MSAFARFLRPQPALFAAHALCRAPVLAAAARQVMLPTFSAMSTSTSLSSTPLLALAMQSRNLASTSRATGVTSYDIKKHSESGLFTSMTIKAESWNYAVLDSFFGFIERTADELGIERNGRVSLPTHRKRYTVLSSPHVSKKHRSQYELKTHKRCIKIKNVTEETASAFIDYIMTHAPPGIASRVIMRAAEKMPNPNAAQSQ
eukprot:m.150420 g.150420  ORF g.150420 m.150420 type:complete len:203 (-) comp16175_c3_seq1:20-628(-)